MPNCTMCGKNVEFTGLDALGRCTDFRSCYERRGIPEVNERIAYILSRFEGETWLDAALRVACEKSNEPDPKQQTKNSVTSVYRDFFDKEGSEEKAAWLTCSRFNLLEFIKL